jgi:hypothetical protein
LTDNVDVFGGLIHTVTARNGHAIHRGVSMGVSWGFSTRSRDNTAANRASGPRAVTAAQTQERTLLRCLCQKG